MNHLDEDAELYALGMLEDDEHERATVHLATCDACTQRVTRAEATVAQMIDDSSRSHERTPSSRRDQTRWFAAAAAVLLVATGSLGVETMRLRSTIAVDNVAYSAIVHSHFAHAPFINERGETLAAKVVYEEHGRWYQILSDVSLHVRTASITRTDGTPAPPITLVRHGDVDVGWIKGSPVQTITLASDDGRNLGTVRLRPVEQR